MDTKEINIQIPDGYKIDKEHSTFEKIVFKKKEEPRFSKNWYEFCLNNRVSGNEVCIDVDSSIIGYGSTTQYFTRHPNEDKNVIPPKFAEPMLALMQLLTIREKEYTKGWEPDWSNSTVKYVLESYNNYIFSAVYTTTMRILSFPTRDLRDKFKETWRELLEIAKPLL